jgi:C4-type Zn-finger protein
MIIEKIKCPNCGNTVMGIITELWPFEGYFGHCENCDYDITESEWNKI